MILALIVLPLIFAACIPEGIRLYRAHRPPKPPEFYRPAEPTYYVAQWTPAVADAYRSNVRIIDWPRTLYPVKDGPENSLVRVRPEWRSA